MAAANLPNFVNVPLAELCSKNFSGVPVVVLNDADAALFAELYGRDSRELYSGIKYAAIVTIGTGIGVGLLLDGHVYQGSSGMIEAGHMITSSHTGARKCGCGQVGIIYSATRWGVVRGGGGGASFMCCNVMLLIKPDNNLFIIILRLVVSRLTALLTILRFE